MKVYQLIYTSVQHSLSDNALGLTSQPGLRVYSCSQGITKENIGEIVRFSAYRLPKNDKTEYSQIIGDPAVPEMFPKIFRTLHLSDGRYAAIQSVYSGVDFQGDAGNFFAHAFVFDEVGEDFFPEQYFGSKKFKMYLTANEAEKELVHYLPMLDDIEIEAETKKRIEEFIKEHKKELSYLLEKAVEVLSAEELHNICIAAENEEITENYLISLKWLLPRDIAYNAGISTYNVYIPSDKQNQIIFNGTIKGKNNITKQAVETRTTCLYIDMDKTDFSEVEISPLLEIGTDELRAEYKKYKFNSVIQLLDWIQTQKSVTAPGMGAKLLHFKASAGNVPFKNRVTELYTHINDEDMKNVRFEISKVAYDNISLFPEISEKITKTYLDMCMDKLCTGENYDIYDLFEDGADNMTRAAWIKDNIPSYMLRIRENSENIGEKNSHILLILLSRIKHESGCETWKEFFGRDKEQLKTFVKLATVIITGGANVFTPPSVWTEEDLNELVAYFEASTQDDKLKAACIKYIYRHDETDWERYGILLTTHKKTLREQEEDMKKIKRMLTRIGYIPYQRHSYMDLRHEVLQDINNSTSPLLLSKLLDAYYHWRSSYGNQAQAEKDAQRLKKLILEMKKNEKTCYDFVFPKLALEITEAPGHYHEQIINTETVLPSFWNWFAIGFEKSRGNDDKIINYTRIYEANKRRLMRTPMGKRLRECFKNKEIS